jgi:DNA-binding CsgD family transcriptional regulator
MRETSTMDRWRKTTRPSAYALTRLEKDCLDGRRAGLTNQEIAYILGTKISSVSSAVVRAVDKERTAGAFELAKKKSGGTSSLSKAHGKRRMTGTR